MLTIHLTLSIGWIGAVVAYLGLVIVAMTNQNDVTLRAIWIALGLIGRLVIVPLALASLLTGLIMALGTRWGLFRHYWVMISLLLTVVAVVVLMQHMQTVGYAASVAAGTDSATIGLLREALSGELIHSGLGLAVLLVIQVLNVYKPAGVTSFGWRKQNVQRTIQS
jgi:hypothetical protein